MNKQIAKLGLFTAIILMLGLTPLGYFNLPIASITMIHIPVIIGSIIFGTKASIYLGGIFGLTSFIRCFTTPDAVAMILLGTNTGGFKLYNLFLIVAILFVPRILTGLFTNLTFKFTKGLNQTISVGISAFVGSMTNTIFFLGGLYLFAFEQAAEGFGMAGASSVTFLTFLLGIVAFNGVLEAITAVVITVAVCKVLLKILKK